MSLSSEVRLVRTTFSHMTSMTTLVVVDPPVKVTSKVAYNSIGLIKNCEVHSSDSRRLNLISFKWHMSVNNKLPMLLQDRTLVEVSGAKIKQTTLLR